MKISNLKRLRFLLVLGFLLPLLWNQNSTIAKAATPSFKKEEIEISGVGEVYRLEVLNKKEKSTYQWSSSNSKVAKVSSRGVITTVNKGFTRIKCRITYASGKTKNLYCDVSVIIPATEIKINYTSEKNGAYVMMVGESYNFNRTITPSNSSDKTYWSIDASNTEANPNAIRIDNSSNGTVTALRRGKVVLVATAAKQSTAKAAEDSYVKDAVIIEVVGASAEVVSAEIINSQKIRVVFGTAIRESTVVNSSGNLSSNIMVAQLDDSSGNTAKDPGILTASLSSDSKTLTITSSNYFQGRYGITFSNSILTTEGKAIYKDYFELNYSDGSTPEDTVEDTDDTDDSDPDDSVIDTGAPRVASTVLDDNGMTTIITFTEKMDFSKFKVTDAKALSSASTVQSSTISFLNSESNYNFSSDGKSILINLSGINAEDYNKAFTVAISNITDIAGNELESDSIVVSVHTETALKAQARPISVVRSSYDTITATFSRSIRTPGYVTINNSGYYYGEVDSDNNKKVNYKISAYDATLTGTQTVSIGHWDSYNVILNDTYANEMHDFKVYFITEKVRPVLTSYDFNSDLNILTLKFSEKVSLNSDKGSLEYTMASYHQDNNIGSLNYSEASTVDNVIEITLSNITLYGDYTFTLPEGFVLDNYQNLSNSRKITIYKNGDEEEGANKLAEPYSIYQSEVNHSFVYIEFADKLDVTTALDINNYNISGATVEELKLISNTVNGATVRLTLGKGTIAATGDKKISISGLKGYNGSSSQMADYSTQLKLIENKVPELLNIKYDATAKNVIVLTFSEQIKGSMLLTVQERSTGNSIGNTVTVSGDKVSITLGSIPNDGTYLQIYVHYNGIIDLNDNESTINPVLNAFVNY
jgi:hypothetical protein